MIEATALEQWQEEHEERDDLRRARDARRPELEAEMLELRANINAATARFVSLVDEHARAEMWTEHDGCSSPAYFLSWQTGLTPHAARDMLGVAQALRDLPLVRAAFAAGELGFEQVRCLVSIAQPASEPELVRLATDMTGAQLARFCTVYRAAFLDRAEARRRRALRSGYRADGTYRMSATVPSEEGAILEAALEAALKDMKGDGDEPDPDADDPLAAQRADALVLVAERSLRAGKDDPSEPSPYQIVVHTDVSVLAAEREPGAPYIEGGGPISGDALRRIACGASFVELTERNGQPLDIGRASRRATRAIRRALKARDETCRFPGCCRKARTDAHHLHGWTAGGVTALDNLALLCRFHHALVHRLGIRVEATEDGFVFTRPDGTVIRPPTAQPATGPTLQEINAEAGIGTDAQTCYPDWGGERGNIAAVAEGYLQSFQDLGLPGRAPPDD